MKKIFCLVLICLQAACDLVPPPHSSGPEKLPVVSTAEAGPKVCSDKFAGEMLSLQREMFLIILDPEFSTEPYMRTTYMTVGSPYVLFRAYQALERYIQFTRKYPGFADDGYTEKSKYCLLTDDMKLAFGEGFSNFLKNRSKLYSLVANYIISYRYHFYSEIEEHQSFPQVACPQDPAERKNEIEDVQITKIATERYLDKLYVDYKKMERSEANLPGLIKFSETVHYYCQNYKNIDPQSECTEKNEPFKYKNFCMDMDAVFHVLGGKK